MIRSFIHSADWHWSGQNIDRCLKSSQSILESIRRISPDLHVIAGDFWDRRQFLASQSAVLPAVDAVQQLADISPVVILAGNQTHDAPGSLEILNHLQTRFPVYASDRLESLLFLKDEADGRARFLPAEDRSGLHPGEQIEALLHLFPFPDKSALHLEDSITSFDELNLLIQQRSAEICSDFGERTEYYQVPTIFIGHCHVSGARISGGQMYLGHDLLLSRNNLALAKAQYYALGHIHQHQQVGPGMWYAGSTYHLNFGEPEMKFFNYVRISGSEILVEPVPIATRPVVIRESLYDAGQHLLIDLQSEKNWHDAELLVRIQFRPEDHLAVTDELVRSAYPGAASYRIERIPLVQTRMRAPEIIRQKSFREKLQLWAEATGTELSESTLERADQLERLVSSSVA